MTPWHGHLELTFGRRQTPNLGTSGLETDRVILTHERVQAPLKIQSLLYPEGPSLPHGITLHTAGGLVAGDRLTFNVDLQANSAALLTSASASKVYRSEGPTTHQAMTVRLGAGACLEWLPQETIVFASARFAQSLRVELAAGATWVGQEVTRLGRTARGEQFVSGEWRSHTELWQGDRPLWIDAQRLAASPTTWASPHGLGGWPVVASWVWAGQPVDRELVQQARAAWDSLELPPPAGQAGVTRLGGELGLLCRYRGPSTQVARRWFGRVWALVRPHYLGRSPCVPAVWGQ